MLCRSFWPRSSTRGGKTLRPAADPARAVRGRRAMAARVIVLRIIFRIAFAIGFPVEGLSPGGAAVNSQGREPLVRGRAPRRRGHEPTVGTRRQPGAHAPGYWL